MVISGCNGPSHSETSLVQDSLTRVYLRKRFKRTDFQLYRSSGTEVADVSLDFGSVIGNFKDHGGPIFEHALCYANPVTRFYIGFILCCFGAAMNDFSASSSESGMGLVVVPTNPVTPGVFLTTYQLLSFTSILMRR